MRWLTGVLALVLALGILAGCGDDEEEPEGGAATPAATEEAADGGGDGGGGETTLTADPGGAIAWDPAALSAPAGSVTISLVNESDVPHAVAIEGETSDTVTGANTEVTLDLEPGEYTYFCPVGSHRAGGMEGTLTVE